MLKLLCKGIGTIGREVRTSVQRELACYHGTPTVGTLVLTYRCTSRCRTCTIWKRPKTEIQELGLAEWKRIVEQLSENNVRIVELFGGDVFLRKDILMPLIKFMKERGMTIHLPTNGNLLSPDIARELVESGVDVIYLSVDGVKSAQDKIRGVDGTFDRARRAIKFLTQARAGKQTPRLVCNTTVSNLNIDSIDDIPTFAYRADFDENHFEYVGEFCEKHVEQSIIDGIKPTPYYMKQEDSVLLNKEEAIRLKNTLWMIRKKFVNTGMGIVTVNIDTLPINDICRGTINNKKCYMLKTEVTVDPYGNVVPCMCVNNYFFGNLVESDFQEIWNNAKHSRFIEQQRTGKLALCKHCIYGVQRNHPFYVSLKRIYYTHILNWYLKYLYKGSDSPVASRNASSVRS